MFTSRQIFDIAQNLIKKYKTRDADTLSRLICPVFVGDLGSLNGLYSKIGDVEMILLSNRLDEYMYNITLLHELGHCILHKEIANFKFIDNADLLQSNLALEYEANAFSAHILIPTDEFLELVYDGYDLEYISAHFCCPKDLVLIKIAEMKKLGHKIRLPYEPNANFLK